MRRSFLILTALSISAWAQPAPAPAQPPIVVQVQMPPTNAPNPWIHFAELTVPGIIGAGLALLGVWLTTKHNDKTNAANRQHQFDVEVAKAKIAASQSWFSAKRDHYEKLLYALAEETRILADLLGVAKVATDEGKYRADMHARLEKWQDALTQLRSLMILTTLYMPDSVLTATSKITQAGMAFVNLLQWPFSMPILEAAQQSHADMLKAFIVAAQSDLGYGEPRPDMPTS